MKAPKGAAVFSDPSEVVDLAGVAAHWCGSELHTAARVSTIANQNLLLNEPYIQSLLH
jgi:hypothetical protein